MKQTIYKDFTIVFILGVIGLSAQMSGRISYEPINLVMIFSLLVAICAVGVIISRKSLLQVIVYTEENAVVQISIIVIHSNLSGWVGAGSCRFLLR